MKTVELKKSSDVEEFVFLNELSLAEYSVRLLSL